MILNIKKSLAALILLGMNFNSYAGKIYPILDEMSCNSLKQFDCDISNNEPCKYKELKQLKLKYNFEKKTISTQFGNNVHAGKLKFVSELSGNKKLYIGDFYDQKYKISIIIDHGIKTDQISIDNGVEIIRGMCS